MPVNVFATAFLKAGRPSEGRYRVAPFRAESIMASTTNSEWGSLAHSGEAQYIMSPAFRALALLVTASVAEGLMGSNRFANFKGRLRKSREAFAQDLCDRFRDKLANIAPAMQPREPARMT